MFFTWRSIPYFLINQKKVLVISMAITKIHPIKSTLNLAIDYITKSEKTNEKILVSSFKCHPSTAHIQFKKTREDNDTKGTVLARHLIQTFLPGEVDPIKAHEIGMELCKKIFKEDYEFVLATHIDRGHIHNHTIFNNVNYKTGKCSNLTKKLTTKSGIKVTNYVKKISFRSLINTMKLTRENIKLLVNLDTNMSKTRKEILGNLNCNLI